jgi:integrase
VTRPFSQHPAQAELLAFTERRARYREDYTDGDHHTWEAPPMHETLRDWIFVRFLPQNMTARDPKTHKQYRLAVNDFAEFLGREPVLTDLTDETVAGLVNYLLGERRQLAPVTANERVGRIKTFWNWAAKKRKTTGVEEFPTLRRVPVPERLPRAWRENDLVKLFNACRHTRGTVAGIPAWRWWFTIHGFWWCTAERISATLAMRVDHLRLDEGIAVLPAVIRKGKRKAAVYTLWPDLVVMLREILPPKAPRRDLVFPWPQDRVTFYNHYKRLLTRAGLATGRDCGPHRMRVSNATWSYLAGDEPSRRLGHSSPETTRKSYIDPTLAKQDETKLFRPW